MGGDHIKVLGVRRGRWPRDVMNQQLIDFYQATHAAIRCLPRGRMR